MIKFCKDCGAKRNGVCLICKAARQRQWRADNAEQYRVMQKRQYENFKARRAAIKAGMPEKSVKEPVKKTVEKPVKHPPWLTVHHIDDTPRSRDACQSQRQFPRMASPLEFLE